MAGLHIGSLVDRRKYRVTLYHEMWHGAYATAEIRPGEYAIVFLTGLQMDFDRMRQLSYFFRRAKALTVAGGSLCTLFPDFARQFFDVVCAGGVDCVVDVMRDYEKQAVKPIYYSPQSKIRDYRLDHRLMEDAGIHVPVHFIEASRGCSFKCDFCSIPAEGATHAVYDLAVITQNIDDSSPAAVVSALNACIRWFGSSTTTSPIIAHICGKSAVISAKTVASECGERS